MLLLKMAEVVIPADRHRTEIDAEDLAELAGSIDALGLMHPIVVRPQDTKWYLVAGERRFRAIESLQMLGIPYRCNDQVIPDGHVAAISIGDLDEIDREEAELDENIKRKDLSWQDRAKAVARIVELKRKKAARDGMPPPSIEELAKEIYVPRRDGVEGTSGKQEISKQAIVARNLDDKDVSSAKTLDDAYKVVRKKADNRANEAHALAVGKVYSAKDHKVFNEDCMLWAPSQLEGTFDCLITDPPYGIGADKFGDSGGRVEEAHGYEDDERAFNQFLRSLGDFSRLCKADAHAYVFCDIDGFHAIRGRLQNCGWTAFRTPLVMHKTNSGRVPLPDFGPRRQYELVAYAYRGTKRVLTIQPDVFQTSMDELLGHGAQKPVEAYINLLGRSCRPGEAVLDPYCGTGTVFQAATRLRLYATGCELDPGSYGIALKRMEGLK